MKKTRMHLILDYPFFGNLALTLKLIEDYSIPTLCVNSEHIRYNPKYIESLAPAERVFDYMHEIGHVILGHSFRRKGRNKELWNIACDYAVDDMLQDSIGNMPKGSLYDPRFRGMSAEAIYARLEDEFKKAMQQMGMTGDSGGQGGAGQGASGGGPGGNPGQPGGNPGTGPGQPGGNPTQGPAQPGGGQGSGQGQPNQPQPDPKVQELQDMINQSIKQGLVEDAPEDLKQHQVESAIVAADRVINSRGKEAGHHAGNMVRDVVAKMTSTKVPWQHLLSRFFNHSCCSRYNWMIPNQRYSFGDVIMPSLKAKDAIKMAIVIDSSGSVDDREVKEFLEEIEALTASIEYNTIHLLSCDTRVYNYREFAKHEPLSDYKAKGGGGTHADPVWKFLKEKGVMPECLVYFTDLEISAGFWGEDPGYPVLWVGRFYRPGKKVPFGEKVLIED